MHAADTGKDPLQGVGRGKNPVLSRAGAFKSLKLVREISFPNLGLVSLMKDRVWIG